MRPQNGHTIPIEADHRQLRDLGLMHFEDACFRCVEAATYLRFHTRSGWLPVCPAHKDPPVEEPKGKRHG